ncbi:MAG: hypothetical protein RL156_752 [Bacteroidota bacterium]
MPIVPIVPIVPRVQSVHRAPSAPVFALAPNALSKTPRLNDHERQTRACAEKKENILIIHRAVCHGRRNKKGKASPLLRIRMQSVVIRSSSPPNGAAGCREARDEYCRQVFRLGRQPFCLPSRGVQWHCRQIVCPYGGATVPDLHGIPYSPYHDGRAPATILCKDTAVLRPWAPKLFTSTRHGLDLPQTFARTCFVARAR